MLAGSSKKRQYTDEQIKVMRARLREHFLTTKLDPEYETFPDDWCVYSWANGNMIKAMHPHDALILELQGEEVTNMTERHGMRPAHLKWTERQTQREFWEGSKVRCLND